MSSAFSLSRSSQLYGKSCKIKILAYIMPILSIIGLYNENFKNARP
jgi:hypothetical protein